MMWLIMEGSLVHNQGVSLVVNFGQGRSFNDHDGLDHNLDSIKLKIPTF
jgi:hypothetical protein